MDYNEIVSKSSKASVKNVGNNVISYKEAKNNVINSMGKIIEEMYKSNESYDNSMFDSVSLKAIDTFVKNPGVLIDGYIDSKGVLEVKKLKESLVLDIQGYGKFDIYIHDPNVSEIEFNDYSCVYIERDGRKSLLVDDNGDNIGFDSKEDYYLFIDKLLMESNEKLIKDEDIIDCFSKEGYRIAVQGEGASAPEILNNEIYRTRTLTIRKQRQTSFNQKELIEGGMICREIANLDELIIEGRLSEGIGGPTGCGKTAYLQTIVDLADSTMRISANGNPAELKLRKRNHKGQMINNVVHLQSKVWNKEGKAGPKYPSARNIARANLRLTPDIIIYEELRSSDEYSDMYDAGQTGHCMTFTQHQISNESGFSRLASEICSHKNANEKTVVRTLSEFVKIMKTLVRYKSGERKVIEVSEVLGYKRDESGELVADLNTLIVFKREVESEDELSSQNINIHSKSSLSRKVKGCHYRVGCISDKLKEQLIDSGIHPSLLEFIAKPLKKDGEGNVIPEKCSYEYATLFEENNIDSMGSIDIVESNIAVTDEMFESKGLFTIPVEGSEDDLDKARSSFSLEDELDMIGRE